MSLEGNGVTSFITHIFKERLRDVHRSVNIVIRLRYYRSTLIAFLCEAITSDERLSSPLIDGDNRR